MNFTVFSNTRGRAPMLKEMLDSFMANTKDLSNVEFLLNVDSDDSETIDFLTNNLYRNLRFHINPRPTNLVKALNELVKNANGQYLFIVNDDCLMTTPNWDEIVLDKISNFKRTNGIKDDIIFCATDDNSVDRDVKAGYPSFAILSNEAVKTLGFFTFEEFVGLGGDSSMYRLYKSVDRVVDCKEVKMDHLYHSTLIRVMTPDRTGAEMRANSNANPVNPYTFNIDKYVKVLSDYISK